MFSRKHIPLSKSALAVGQPVIFPIYNKQGQLLLEKGQLLNEREMKILEDYPELFTMIEDFQTAKTRLNKDLDTAYHLPSPQKRLATVEDLITEVYAKPTHSVSFSKILTATNRLKVICEKSPDASLAKIILDDNQNYTVRHSIHTAILSCLTAMHLEWNEEQVREIVSAALTMNISLGFMQDKLAFQQESLTEDQQEAIAVHPTESAKMLRHLGVHNSNWLDFVAKHHECIDGSGYPNKYAGDQLPMGALILSLSDIYCAKVSGRSYRQPIFANIAARDIYLVKDQLSRGTLIEVFVKILGLYPPGCFVRLMNDEIGIVIKRGERVDTPMVQVLDSSDTKSFVTDIKRKTSEKKYSIKSIIPPDQIEKAINYDSIWKT